MERIQSLINRLQEQVDQHAGAEQMLATIQLIQAELGHTNSLPGKILGTSKVAVIMPATTQFFVKQVGKRISGSGYSKTKADSCCLKAPQST